MNDEPERPDPGFRVYVERGSDKVDITHAAMDVYDIAINSMDFGSGFLSTEEVGNLRALGKAIGAKTFDYQHDKCLRCGHDHERHSYSGSRECIEYRYTQGAQCSCSGYIQPI